MSQNSRDHSHWKDKPQSRLGRNRDKQKLEEATAEHKTLSLSLPASQTQTSMIWESMANQTPSARGSFTWKTPHFIKYRVMTVIGY